MISRVFISKNANDCEPLVTFCNQNKLELVAQSLLEFESVPFKDENDYDIVFFSSIRSGKFYLENANTKLDILYACIGEETNKKLKKLGIYCQFIGEDSGNPQKTAIDFKNWVENKIVLFPQSNLSLGTFSKLLPHNQVKKVEVYKTNLLQKQITKCQIYIFTSPSNLDAFLTVNEIPIESTVIAWGQSTNLHAIQKGINCKYVLNKSNMNELIEILQKKLLMQI